MIAFSFDDGWKLLDSDPGKGDLAGFSRPGLDTCSWLDVPVPGDVNAALVAAGRMPDPNYGDNARKCYWVTARDWWYRREFVEQAVSSGVRRDLCLDGVDGHADVYLNGEKLARIENAFRPYRLDVNTKLKTGKNVLLIRFLSINIIMGGPREDELKGWGEHRTIMRKPQFSFGWDWSLPLPSIGISGGVWIERHRGPRLLDVSVQTFISGRLDFAFLVNTEARDAGARLKLRVWGNEFEHGETIERPGRVNSYTTVQVPDPVLWRPRGMGEAAIYNYEVVLDAGGEILARRHGTFGIRESRIVEEPFTPEAGPGFSFWLEINGHRVFCKGANWIPPGIWPGAVSDESYRFYLYKAADAGFNMLRVWGGGIYERELFYDLCDELGIMVWQDFMFAGAACPLDRLRSEIIAEAEYQIKRLRNRACVTIWCGCNEDVFSWGLPDEEALLSADTGVYSEAGPDSQLRRLRDDPQIYTMILRGLVSRHGFGIPYVESSPQSREDVGNMPESGNCHISCWKYGLFETGGYEAPQGLSLYERYKQGYIHAEKFRGHFEQVCSFDSEFCIQGPSDVRTMKQFLTEGHHWPPDDVWTFHIQKGHAYAPHHEQTIMFAESVFGPVNSLQEYVKYGQALHAEMMRAEFESARRDRPNNGGTMVWMLNDCWPTANWSIIDYYRRPKPAYYAAKRACAALLPIIFERAGRIEFFFSNDGREPCRVQLNFGLVSLDGAIVWEERQELTAGANSTPRFHSMSKAELKRSPGDHLFIDALVEGRRLPRVTYFPDLWMDIDWPAPDVQTKIADREEVDGAWVTSIDVSTNAYARFCHLLLRDDSQSYWIDDNFFDLAAGSSRRIAVRSLRPFEDDELVAGDWHVDWP